MRMVVKSEWQGRVIFWMATTAIVTAVAWSGVVTQKAFSSVTREDVIEITNVRFPWPKDKPMVMDRITQAEDRTSDLMVLVKEQTTSNIQLAKAVHELRIEVSYLRKEINAHAP